MAAFLLWNVNKGVGDSLDLQNLVRQHSIDIVLLVEFDLATSQLSRILETDGFYRRPSSSRFRAFCPRRSSVSRLRHRLGRRVNMWRSTPPSGQEGLLVLVHGLDPKELCNSARRVFFRRVAEKLCGTKRNGCNTGGR